MSAADQFDLSTDEVHELIRQYPKFARGRIHFGSAMSDRDKQQLAKEFSPYIREMQNVMTALIADKDDCVTRSAEFAFGTNHGYLEYLRTMQGQR